MPDTNRRLEPWNFRDLSLGALKTHRRQLCVPLSPASPRRRQPATPPRRPLQPRLSTTLANYPGATTARDRLNLSQRRDC
ncbi:hypothetical protein HBI56_169620 [Parastagonospora nodorum]|nr:hypothetical protein HBH53_185040 [Parastagonospora nodorum]KAH3989164.1 hypothetical protein HBH52_024100 [Parastagonospora nodorum]KAH4037037.1 hypothetical protein HBI09_065110 [Parastagonospora nodorum]KAH4057836.1 hypothetical protein HBH50_235640 [Parastagonospora nodorum]KAH4079271.1 hypothetical protein HBH48_221600 [Parastagonospora nodorum]